MGGVKVQVLAFVAIHEHFATFVYATICLVLQSTLGSRPEVVTFLENILLSCDCEQVAQELLAPVALCNQTMHVWGLPRELRSHAAAGKSVWSH